MKTCKVNPLKLNETRFLADVHNKEGRYVKRYFFSNGLGSSVVCHDGSIILPSLCNTCQVYRKGFVLQVHSLIA